MSIGVREAIREVWDDYFLGWDADQINDGYCEDLADAVEGICESAEAIDLGIDSEYWGHVFLYDDVTNLYHDAEYIEGVSHYSRLPYFLRKVFDLNIRLCYHTHTLTQRDQYK